MYAIAPLLPGFDHADSVPTVTATPALILKPDPRRVLIYISHASSQNLMLWHNSPVPDVSQPGLVVAANSTRRIAWQDDGPLVTWGWYAAYGTGSGPVSLLEVFWHPEQLARSLVG